MALADLACCATCGHPRHSHPGQWTEMVNGQDTWHHGACLHCDCKGFLEPRAAALDDEDGPNAGA